MWAWGFWSSFSLVGFSVVFSLVVFDSSSVVVLADFSVFSVDPESSSCFLGGTFSAYLVPSEIPSRSLSSFGLGSASTSACVFFYTDYSFSNY
jgi:hypothetical protein